MKCPLKWRALFEKDMLEKSCAVSHQEVLVTHGKSLLIESIAMSHNAKYYVKCLKRNKVHSSDIKGL